MFTLNFNRENVNQTPAGRVRTNKQYHFRNTDYIPSRLDNFNGKELESLWNEQKGKCACCGESFNGELSNVQIGHKTNNGLFNKINIQLLCPDCNKAQASLYIDFIEIKKEFGRYFVQLWKTKLGKQKLMDFLWSQIDDKAIGRFDNLVSKKG